MVCWGMLYSSGCEHVVRAMAYLAQRPPGERTMLGEIAEAEALPSAFLAKLLNRCVRAGLLDSTPGPGGGYWLAHPPDEISLLRIKDAVEGTEDLERCAAGLDLCSDDTPCPLHDAFKPLRERIRRYLEETTLDGMARALWEKQALQAQQRLKADSGRGPASRSEPRPRP